MTATVLAAENTSYSAKSSGALARRQFVLIEAFEPGCFREKGWSVLSGHGGES
jgi:hypothetical protein